MPERRFHSKYPFRHILCYIPKRYTSLRDWQQHQCRIIENFKNCYATAALYDRFVQAIRSVTAASPARWVVTFVPPSVGYDVEYAYRYGELASYITEHLPDVPVIYYGVSVADEWSMVPKHLGGRRSIEPGNLAVDPQAFQDRAVILIDDVITTGYTFRTVGDALMQAGATRIYGVILAMTIHPNLPVKEKTPRRRKKNLSYEKKQR